MVGTKQERIEYLDSLYPEWENHTLYSRFAVNAERFAEDSYIIYRDRAYSYRLIKEQSDILSRTLYACGVRPGHHVAVFLYNSPLYFYATFALARLGAVKVPVNMKLRGEELLFTLQKADVDWAIGTALPERALLSQVQTLKGVMELPAPETQDFVLLNAEIEAKAATIAEKEMELLEIEYRNPFEVSDILFTSGSTSVPKGVVLTHDMLLRSSYATCRTRLFEKGRKIFVPIPLYHIMAYNECMLSLMYVGGCLVLSDGKFEPHKSVELMQRHKVDDIVCVSYVMQEILKLPEVQPGCFPSMHAAYWAAACPEWVWDRGFEVFGTKDIGTAYGLTECSSTSVMMPPFMPKEYLKQYHGCLKDAGAAGAPEYKGNLVDLCICDTATGLEQPAGCSGEICIRGLSVTPGYYMNEEANAKAFTVNGWFRTGDCGVMHENGMLTYLGRIDDCYKINGENVSPQYIDSVLGRCPGVLSVETVGVPDEKYGAVGVAFADVGDAGEKAQADLKAYASLHLASYQVPRYWVFESSREWPRTASQKIQKKKLQQRAEKILQRY